MTLQDLTGQTFGQYEMRELLGVGGMGAVYRGIQTSLQRAVAIKVLSTQLASEPGYLERFYREAKTAAALEHAHIVAVYDYGIQRDISYVVMRLLTGGALSERVQRRLDTNQPLPSAAEIAGLLRQVASALDYAHSQNVIHRDIKPSNIMFDNQGNAYLVDFGIAKLLGSTSGLTGTGMVMGTPSYMPPEQWRSEDLTPAADQYALGVMVYSLLAGRVPYEATTPFGLMHKHLNETPTPVHVHRPGLPPDVTLVLERALAKAPKERFPTVTAFAQAFERAASVMGDETTGFFTMSMPSRKPAASATMATAMESAAETDESLEGETSAVTPSGAAAPVPKTPARAGAPVSKTPTAKAAPTKSPTPAKTPASVGANADLSMPMKIDTEPTRPRWWIWAAGAVVLVILAGILFAVLSQQDDEKAATATTTITAGEIIPTEPEATATTAPLIAVVPSDTPEVTATIAPTNTPEPTNTLEPTATTAPTNTLEPTATTTPTNTPEPTVTPVAVAEVEVKEVVSGSTLVIGVTGTTIRTRPSQSAETIATVANATLPLTGTTPDELWYRVEYQGQPGWIRRSAAVRVQAPLEEVVLVVGVTGARVRIAPAEDAEILATVSNIRLKIIGRSGDNRWYLVQREEREGWIRQSAGVRVTGNLDSVPVIETEAAQEVVAIVGPVNAFIRRAPNANAEAVGSVANSHLTITGRTADSEWLRVAYEGENWIRRSANVRVEGDLDSVPVIEPEAARPEVVAIVGPVNAFVRRAPNANAEAVGSVANSHLTIIGRTADSEWLRVAYEGENWIRRSANVRVEGDLDSVPVIEPEAAQPEVVAIVGPVNAFVRRAPNANAEAVGSVANSHLTITGRTADSEWLRVAYEGENWIRRSANVRVEGDLDSVPVIDPEAARPEVVAIVGPVNAFIRRAPNANAEAVGSVANFHLTITGRTADSEWLRVAYEGENWIRRSANVRVEGDLDSVPVVE